MDKLRTDAANLLNGIGIDRIVIVDDAYAQGVEELISLCSTHLRSTASTLPYLDSVDVEAPDNVWHSQIRTIWETLDQSETQNLIRSARARVDETSARSADGDELEDDRAVDQRVASTLEQIFVRPNECEFVPLSLGDWEEKRDTLLADSKAPTTVYFFDRNFEGERIGTDDKGIALVRDALDNGSSYSGLITHTVSPEGEYNAWQKIANEQNLDRDRFVVISKGRLNNEPPEYYGFLAMLRLTALSSRYAQVRTTAWTIFEQSLLDAQSAIERLSVVDFDRMVFASSFREGVWELDTFFRIFSILMRREASRRLHNEPSASDAVKDARNVSAAPADVINALDAHDHSEPAMQIQRFEIYDEGDQINKWHIPIGNGDVFRVDAVGKDYLLLAQPCDLVVRNDGFRNNENAKFGRTAAIVEVVKGGDKTGSKWGKLPFYDEETGAHAYVHFGKAHQIALAVLDLCVFGSGGVSTLDVDQESDGLMIEALERRFTRLSNYYREALKLCNDLGTYREDLSVLGIPHASLSLDLAHTASQSGVTYDVRRIRKLRQPWSGALLTEFAQYQARMAYEHDFGYKSDES